jgi:hypothetical protein
MRRKHFQEDLTKGEASRCIDALKAQRRKGETPMKKP